MAREFSLGAKYDKILEELDFSSIKKKDKVAIKMHLGFKDGYQTVPVFFIRRLVQKVKETGAFPFVTDNPTAVYNAVERGYTAETCGCPIIPIAGVKDAYKHRVEVGYKTVDYLDMAGVMKDSDVLIDVSHVKGHGTAGFGGAFKNIALGGYCGTSRWRKIHGVEKSAPYWDGEKCSPEHAKRLAESCPYGALKYDEEKHYLDLGFGDCHNANCLECLRADEKVGCLKIPAEGFAAFQELMAIASKKILDNYDRDKQFFLNFIMDVTPHCDCLGMVQPQIVPDIGIVGGKDIVAVEQASLDLIKTAKFLVDQLPPYLKHVSSDVNLHPFQRIWGPYKNPYLVTEYGEQLGLGTRDYELVEILSASVTKDMETGKQSYEDQPTFF
jgi:uncharacterized Fe-S center protein